MWTEYISLSPICLSFQSRFCCLHPSLKSQLLSHAASDGPLPLLGLCSVSQQICCSPRKWHAHPVVSNSDWPADTEWRLDSWPLELSSSHESLPPDDNCYRPIHGIHGDRHRTQPYVGADSPAWMVPYFRSDNNYDLSKSDAFLNLRTPENLIYLISVLFFLLSVSSIPSNVSKDRYNILTITHTINPFGIAQVNVLNSLKGIRKLCSNGF